MKTPENPPRERDEEQPGYAVRDDEPTTEQTGGVVRTEEEDDRWATDEGD